MGWGSAQSYRQGCIRRQRDKIHDRGDDKPEFVPGTDGVDDVSTVVPLNESVEQSMSDHNISNITTTSYSSPKGEVPPLQEKFMCFICGKKDFIFKKETCRHFN